MATVRDATIQIRCASQLANLVRLGLNDVLRTLHLMPYDPLRASGQPP